MNTSATSVPEGLSFSAPYWEKVGNFVALLAYSGIVLFTVRYHEKWADEAQAWLLARDLDLKTLFFHELRYEGHPGLWHLILWLAQRAFHAPYGAISYIGVAFAIAGAALLIFKAPFPWYVRWPLAFTYCLVYQYAVIARPYTLLPLLCFAVAIFFNGVQHPARMTLVLALMANLIVHGAILAACFGLLFLLQATKSWPGFDGRVRTQYFMCAALMVCVFLFLVVTLKPTSDIEEFVAKREVAQLSQAAKQQMNIVGPITKLETIVSGAFLDFFLPSALFVLAAAYWCLTRRRFLVFALPVGSMIAVYSIIHGAAHHHGTATVAAITALWIAWPTRQEQNREAKREKWQLRGMIALLLIFCAVNIWDAAVVIKREYLYPYSGADDAARYLRAVGADRGPMFGFLFGVVAVQAHFNHNIFANVPTAYFHHGLPLAGTSLDVEELERIQPEYIVAYSQDPQLMLEGGLPQLTTRGYELVHFSDGYYLYKRAVFEREVYFILRRISSCAVFLLATSKHHSQLVLVNELEA